MKKSRHHITVYLFTKTLKNNGSFFIFSALFVATFCLPIIASHAYYFNTEESQFTKIQKQVSFAMEKKPEIIKITVTAYSSTSKETDSTPCLTATNYDLCWHNVENVVACNFLPIGTIVKFPDLDPDKYYTVVDRMHEKYNDRIDIWKKSHIEAEKFGIKSTTVEIYKQ